MAALINQAQPGMTRAAGTISAVIHHELQSHLQRDPWSRMETWSVLFETQGNDKDVEALGRITASTRAALSAFLWVGIRVITPRYGTMQVKGMCCVRKRAGFGQVFG